MNTTKICGHNVQWFVNSKSKEVQTLSDFEEDRIADLLYDGFTQGELNMTYTDAAGRRRETQGWWMIINWQDIALELYNVLKSIGPNSFKKIDHDKYKKAIRRFDENWR